MTALPDEVFINVLLVTALDEMIHLRQKVNEVQLKEWQKQYQLEHNGQAWYRCQALVVTGQDGDKRALLQAYHNTSMVGHLEVAKMLQSLSHNYWWLTMHTFVQEYVRGCTKCQENKSRMHPNVSPIQPITPQHPTQPFATIVMDFIVKLPILQGYDSILTVMDHDCTKAVILLLCKEEIDTLGVAKLYLRHIFPIVGLPDKVISDRDTRFTSKVFKEVCNMLKIKQNVASTYHLQTDG